MPAHGDILDQRDPLGKPLAGSLAVHGAFLAALAFGAILTKTERLGDVKVGSGTVGINVVKTIPIPARHSEMNRLASNTESTVPQPPPKAKEQEKARVPDEKAIPIPSRQKPKPQAPVAAPKYAYRPQTYAKNQIYSTTAPALSSPNFGMQGNNGISLGPNTSLGDRFGWYVQLLEDRIGSHWNHADVNGRNGIRASVIFTIKRDGSIGDVKIGESSGNYVMDLSAKRAVLDASPVQPLPPGFNHDSANVEFWFELKQ